MSTQEILETWKRITNFRGYDVSNFGQIANRKTDTLLRPSVTQQGALKVGLWKDGKQHTRSVKVLVAKAFVDQPRPMFDCPIHLDGNQLNVRADNLVWRPRWFANKFARQFEKELYVYTKGPIVELDEEGVVCGAYLHTKEAAMMNGLLFEDVWDSIHTRRTVFPTGQIFALADKV